MPSSRPPRVTRAAEPAQERELYPVAAEIPELLQVGPHRVVVISDQEGYESIRDEIGMDPSDAGAANAWRGVIVMEPGSSPTQAADTIVHEALHHIANATDLPSVLWNVAQANGPDTVARLLEEAVCTVLAPWVLMFLQDNPDAVAWLQAQANR